MGRWIAGVLMLVLLSACTPGGTPPPSPTLAPTTTAPTSASPTPAGTATPSDEPTVTASPACDFLPAGVDPRACQAPPAAAPPIPESAGFPGLFVFSTGDGRVRCDLNGGDEFAFAACAVRAQLSPVVPELECDAGDWDNNFVFLWQPTGEAWEAGQGSCRGDPLTSELSDPPARPQDAVLGAGDLAALATPDGVVVWHANARHGFAVVADQVVTW